MTELEKCNICGVVIGVGGVGLRGGDNAEDGEGDVGGRGGREKVDTGGGGCEIAMRRCEDVVAGDKGSCTNENCAVVNSDDIRCGGMRGELAVDDSDGATGKLGMRMKSDRADGAVGSSGGHGGKEGGEDEDEGNVNKH